MTAKIDFETLNYLPCPVSVLEISADGDPCYVSCNATALAQSGRHQTDMLGRTARDAFPGSTGETRHQHHLQIVLTGKAATCQIPADTGDGLLSDQITCIPELDHNGDVCRIYETCLDAPSTQAVHDARVNFETLSVEMEQFVAMAAHDLRAPMRNISLLADMLRDALADSPSEALDLVDLVDDVATKSLDLISDVLDHAAQRDLPEQKTGLDFGQLCATIRDVLDPAGRHQARFSSAQIMTDGTALQVILRNLIENAFRRAAPHGVTLDVFVQSGLPGMLDFTLTDNGTGFCEDTLKTLNMGALRPANGYGLIAVKRLITARGGSIFARNASDQGIAMLRFSLPGKLLSAHTPLIGTIGAPFARSRPDEISRPYTA